MRQGVRGGSNRRQGAPSGERSGTVGTETGRRRRLTSESLGPSREGPVGRDRRALPAGSRAFIQDAGKSLPRSIPHDRPGDADPTGRGLRPGAPCRARPALERTAMLPRFTVGIDVALHTHRIAVLGPDGEACGPSFTIAATTEGVSSLRATLQARGAHPAHTIVGLEATGHMWENLEAALTAAGYHVVVLNPLQTRRFRDVLRRKAKTDDIDAHVIAGLLRSGAASACYVPDEPIQSLRELARLRARLMRESQDYLRQLAAQLDVVFPAHQATLGNLSTARARGHSPGLPDRPPSGAGDPPGHSPRGRHGRGARLFPRRS